MRSGVTLKTAATVAFATLALAACASTPRENAALAMAWPKDGDNTRAAGRPAQRFPSLRGDILSGTEPETLAAARAATSAALDQALAKP